ncbi:AAA family ATPase [Mesorhizobium calcicola]|uniref:AAA family ATPase n=1 Tax=Mesorhizobium calcicola TaxID=1300310 RepID=A0ABW4WEA8_9HYPH
MPHRGGEGVGNYLRWIAAQSGAPYCEVAQHSKAVRLIFQMLHDAYGVQKDSKFTYDLGKDCINFLDARYGATRALLVDEYQNFTPTVLRELLHLQECCGFPLLLSGNAHRLAGTRRDTNAMDQIESRIGMRFEIGQPTREDWVNTGAEHNVVGADAYEAIVIYGENTSLRALCHLPRTALPLPTALAAFVFPGSRPRFVSCRAAAMRLSYCTSAETTSGDRLNFGQRQLILNGTLAPKGAGEMLAGAPNKRIRVTKAGSDDSALFLRLRLRSESHLQNSGRGPSLPPRASAQPIM